MSNITRKFVDSLVALTQSSDRPKPGQVVGHDGGSFVSAQLTISCRCYCLRPPPKSVSIMNNIEIRHWFVGQAMCACV